jgi:putative endonuclease
VPRGLGAFGESWAVGYLSRHGYTILERNVRFRDGELDIVARDGNCLVFVEVKCRRSDSFGSPEDAISPRRFALFEHAALQYVAREALFDAEYRLDLIALVVGPRGDVVRFNHLQGIESPSR